MTFDVTSNSERNKTFSLALLVLIGLTLTFLLSRWIDARRPPPDPNVIDESLYLNGKTASRISLGFNGLAADWYWMRSLQYVGGKIMKLPDNVALDDLSQLNLKLLPSLLDTATTLDPQFLDPYEYAAVVLPAVNVEEAIRITKKGVEANPDAWRLYQHLGYIYWQQHDYQAASEAYGRGAHVAGAPAWMEAMKARMAAEGGSRSTAREIYTRMYEQSSDVKVKDMARRRVMQVDAMDQMDVMRKLLATYFERTKRCPASWKEIEPVFRAIRIRTDPTGAPLDPSGTPYVFGKTNCDVELNAKSEIPAK
jgi:tetratricopeptide (TPR) repeat protein